MKDLIQLFEPEPLVIPVDITTFHWEGHARWTENDLGRFLGLGADAGVLLVDRATHAIQLALESLSQPSVILPRATYRAAEDAALRAGKNVYYADKVQFPPETAGGIAVPTTLGGTRPVYLGTDGPFVYDCAHTCYPDMFQGVAFTPEQFAVLSFYPTKPLGALGGGALIGDLDTIEALRPRAWPVLRGEYCDFFYPQTVQSWAISERIGNWDEAFWKDARADWAATADWVMERYGLNFAWSQPAGATMESPHLLSFTGDSATVRQLRRDCRNVNIETGIHYPSLCSWGVDNTSVPFLGQHVEGRLG
jgi:hypothetical protein